MLVSAVVIAAILITTALAYSIDWLAEYIPYEYEKNIAQSFESKSDERNLVDDYLQQLADNLTRHMDMPEGMEITVHYVNQDIVNAMATLGGHIFIYRGLLEKLPHENALVMLLGHEIGHIKLRHPIKGLGKGIIISLVLAALLGQSSDVASGLLTDTSTLTMLSFSREQEEHADLEGLHATQNYFQHTKGADDLFKVLLHEHDEKGIYVPQIMSSHPDTQYRITLINQLVSDYQWPTGGVLHPIPETITTRLTSDKKTD
ncbi:MAG: M48 family metallopeptidase [Gammaproteobacteria bacterium]|nr:M48 family metallopeptidase [Gammaproteobacteria bacterium]MDH5734671.1 M48 family metallopeptidase [Gammaproteobacteria bacterium]